MTVHFGKASYRIYPGQLTLVTYTLDARGPWSIPFHSNGGGRYIDDLRAVGVQSSPPELHRAGAPTSRQTGLF
ncbi:MAG TPA: hypothetical protein VGQ38_14635 [Gaiellaceae bacterium]|nr:hypothetical protein [Gaiellaceae bacterium]